MAKDSLKVVKKDDFDKIEPDGYVSIIDQLVMDDVWLDVFDLVEASIVENSVSEHADR